MHFFDFKLAVPEAWSVMFVIRVRMLEDTIPLILR